jgi:hypothetical protein
MEFRRLDEALDAVGVAQRTQPAWEVGCPAWARRRTSGGGPASGTWGRLLAALLLSFAAAAGNAASAHFVHHRKPLAPQSL